MPIPSLVMMTLFMGIYRNYGFNLATLATTDRHNDNFEIYSAAVSATNDYQGIVFCF
jgi:hypothetical protein